MPHRERTCCEGLSVGTDAINKQENNNNKLDKLSSKIVEMLEMVDCNDCNAKHILINDASKYI